MTTFTIETDNTITAYAPGEEIPAGDSVQKFSSPESLDRIILASECPGDRLVEIWNNFAGVVPFDDLKPVRKFTDRKTGVARIWKAILRLEAARAPQGAQGAPKAKAATQEATAAKNAPKTPKGAKKAKPKKAAGKEAKETRKGTKSALVLELIRRPKGATIQEIMKATDWQAHSVRGFVSGAVAKKMGIKVESIKRDSGERAYQVAQ